MGALGHCRCRVPQASGLSHGVCGRLRENNEGSLDIPKWHITKMGPESIYAESPVPGGDNKAGLGDIVQSFFFSPKEPTSGGWIWGAGPVFLYPSATERALGTEKFGLGPTAVVLKQPSGWTYGILINHIWSVAGN